MEAKETLSVKDLRIGNLVIDHGVNNIWEITRLGQSSITIGRASDKLEIDLERISDCEGIPLTAEWLERMGFEKEREAEINEITNTWKSVDVWKDREGIFKLKEVVLAGKDMLGNDKCFAVRSNGFARHHPIRTVHQLQNLFYALTNTELEIKEHGSHKTRSRPL